MSHVTGPSRDDMRRIQDQFLELPQVMRFAREHGEDIPIWPGRPNVRQMRAMVYPEWYWWFQQCVDNREV